MEWSFQKYIWVLIFTSVAFLNAGEDDGRQDRSGLYLYPKEAISLEEIRLLETETRFRIDPDSGIAIPIGRETDELSEGREDDASPNNDAENLANQDSPEEEETGVKSTTTKIKEAEGLLRRYYSQFLSEKRIWEDKNRGSKFSSKNEQNDIRLMMIELHSRLSESKLVRDSEIIYFLHKRLGELYSENESYANSLRHYHAAYRYRNLSSTEEYFLNESVWDEVIDEDLLDRRRIHKNIRQTLLEEKKILDQEYKKLHRIGSEYARGMIGFEEYSNKKKNQELIIESEKAKLDNMNKDYENSLESNYLPYKIQKSMEDSENIYKIANLVRKVEDKNKERIKVVNKTTFAGRGVFVLFDYKRNTDFPAYNYLLELSLRLNPEFTPAIRDVAKQLKIDGKKLKSIDYYTKYVNLMETRKNIDPEENEELADAYLNLGILNSDLNRKVIAIDYYEKFIKNTNDEEKKKSVYFEMGRFFQNEIGDLNNAKKYYNLWLAGNSEDKKKLTFAYYGLSLYEKKNQYLEKEIAILREAYNNYKGLRSDLSDKNTEIATLEREINRYKRDLLLTTDDESLAQFRILQLKMEDVKLERDKIKSDYLSIPKSRIVLRLAEIAETNRNHTEAITYYDELIDIGNESEVNHALKSRKRIQQKDGIHRTSKPLY